MHLETFAFDARTGWSVPSLPQLDSARTLVLAFASPRLFSSPEPLAALRAAYPQSCVLGCSTAGEIAGAVLRDDSVGVAVARFEHTTLRQASAFVESAENSAAAGEALGRRLAAPELRAVFVLSDGIRVNGTQLVAGLGRGLPPGVIVTGGLAGDGDRFQRTYVIGRRDGGEIEISHGGMISAVGLYGDRVRVGAGSRGGWDIFGVERVVTRSKGNVLYELDGQPALQLYKTYLGDRAAGLPATALLFPLALRAGRGDELRTVRTILGVDEAAQSLTFAGDVPEGALAQLMRANFERLIDAAAAAAADSLAIAAEGPRLTIAISCVGRRLVLGQRAEEEIEAIAEPLPPTGRLVGFYSYGEICPQRGAVACGGSELHNQTMTLTSLGEA